MKMLPGYLDKQVLTCWEEIGRFVTSSAGFVIVQTHSCPLVDVLSNVAADVKGRAKVFGAIIAFVVSMNKPLD